MHTKIIRSTTLFYVICFLPVLLSAQGTETVLHNDTDRGVCGLGLFSPDDPVHQQAVAALKADPVRRARAIARMKELSESRSLASVGEIETFYVLNRVSQDFDQVASVLRYDGRLARIWVDVKDTSRVSAGVLNQLARGLDSVTGSSSRNPALSIIENNTEVFGQTPKTYEVEGKTDFLLTDIQDGLTGGGYIAGYFSGHDQSRDYGSNARNLLYIDSRQGLANGVSALLNTLAHEFQHLVHYGVNPGSTVFFNEGCSEVASILCGYKTRGNSGFMSNTNVRLLGWNYGNTSLLLADYERAMTFVYYLYDRYGENFIRRFTQMQSNGLTRIDQALSALGLSGSYQEVLKGFAVANAVTSGIDDDRYRYETRLSSTTPRVSSTYDTLLPASGSVSLQSYGSTYILLKNPTPISVTFTSARSFRVMAVIYRANVADEVVEMEPETAYLLNGDGAATRITFGVVSLYGSTATVDWESAQAPAGIDNAEGVANVSRLAVITPQPVTSGHAEVLLALPRAGEVRIDLFDASGRLTASPVTGEWVEAGERRFPIDAADLASGAYLLRIAMPGAVVTKAILVRER